MQHIVIFRIDVLFIIDKMVVFCCPHYSLFPWELDPILPEHSAGQFSFLVLVFILKFSLVLIPYGT